MKIIVEGNITGAKKARQRKGIAIMVDALRASVSLTTAMNCGIKKIYIVKDVKDTRLIAKKHQTLLMGERNTIKLPNFDFGNSPTEIISEKKLPAKPIAFTSSTGARRIIDTIGSEATLVGSAPNAQAIVHFTQQLYRKNEEEKPIIIIPGYTEGPITKNLLTEDQLGGLIIAREFQKEAGNEPIDMSSELLDEIGLLNSFLETQSLYDLFLKTHHAKKLINRGLKSDVEFCSKINVLENVPYSLNDYFSLENGAKVMQLKNYEMK
ncbi:MAG: hypothetical protein GF308_13020 [Candidatus Heimdallarchaeota archaeon]|nr:hypothetical protein [Candidatus Heimdallarchaeota archaeon]